MVVVMARPLQITCSRTLVAEMEVGPSGFDRHTPRLGPKALPPSAMGWPGELMTRADQQEPVGMHESGHTTARLVRPRLADGWPPQIGWARSQGHRHRHHHRHSHRHCCRRHHQCLCDVLGSGWACKTHAGRASPSNGLSRSACKLAARTDAFKILILIVGPVTTFTWPTCLAWLASRGWVSGPCPRSTKPNRPRLPTVFCFGRQFASCRFQPGQQLMLPRNVGSLALCNKIEVPDSPLASGVRWIDETWGCLRLIHYH